MGGSIVRIDLSKGAKHTVRYAYSHAYIHVIMYVCLYVCMYVCMCIHMCVRKYNNLYRSTFGCIYDVRVCVGCFKIPHLIDGPELFVSGLTNKYQIDMIAKKREIESQRV